ncbi:hypothetical protein GTO27_13430 [Candidatus Bathyarchaeota archaeon]|nr:hypothetical protein [Candidatus Bathyarchaeota archaeon]
MEKGRSIRALVIRTINPGVSGIQYRFYYRTPEFPSTMPSTNVYFSCSSGGQAVAIVSTEDIHEPIPGIWVTPSGGTHGTVFTANVSVDLYLTL